MDIIAGEFRFHFRTELLCGCSVIGIGNLQPDVLVLRHAAETLVDVLFNSIDHHGLALRGGSCLCKGIQLFSLNSQYRLQAKHGADGCGRRSDAPTFFQVIQGVKHNIDTAVKFIVFQKFLDLGSIFTGCCKLQSIQCGLTLGYGDPLVIHHLNLTVIICGKSHGTLTGAGQTAAHGNVYDLVIFL